MTTPVPTSAARKGWLNPKPTFAFQYHAEPMPTDMVVFVHGLIGDIVGTWGKFPALLASDPDLPKMDIFLCGYRTRLLRWDPAVTVVGRRLIAELENRIKGDDALYLVGHSMGGLVLLSGLVETCRDGFAQRSPAKNVAWLTLYASPTLGAEVAAAYHYLVGLLRFFSSTRLLGWAFASRQVKELQRGSYLDTLNREVMQRLYCKDIEPGDANTKRFVNVRVVVGDEDRIVPDTSGTGLFHRLPPKRVSGTDSSMKEPENHADSRYLALSLDIADSMKEQFSALCRRCMNRDTYAQAIFQQRWGHALDAWIAKVYHDHPDKGERRLALRSLTWKTAAADASLTPGQAFWAAMLQL